MNLREKAALATKCPLCGAGPGVLCRSVDMRRPNAVSSFMHRARIVAHEAVKIID